MPFSVTIAFVRSIDRDGFVEKGPGKIHGSLAAVESPGADAPEADILHRAVITVTSPTAAREVCHHVASYLAHAKGSRVDITWVGADGESQYGEVNAGALRDADLLATRVGAAAKAIIDAEKSRAKTQD